MIDVYSKISDKHYYVKSMNYFCVDHDADASTADEHDGTFVKDDPNYYLMIYMGFTTQGGTNVSFSIHRLEKDSYVVRVDGKELTFDEMVANPELIRSIFKFQNDLIMVEGLP